MTRRLTALEWLALALLVVWVALLVVARIWAAGVDPAELETPPVACSMAGGVLLIDPAGVMICETWNT